jgi:mannose-1-phosphate guanylyltransferase
MVLYGDNLIKVDVARMLALHEDRRGAGTIAVHSVQDVRASGAVGLDPEDRITTFVEKAPLAQPVAGWVNAGIYVLEKAVVKAIPVDAPSDFGFDVFPTLLRGGVSLYGYRLGPTEAIYPIDTPELYREANRSFDPH